MSGTETRVTGGVPVVDDDRSARLMSVLVAVSRASGLIRMVVALAVLGTSSPLSNVYSSANTVPTLLFEMLAAGALSATLVPELRRRFAAGDHDGARRIEVAVLTWAGGALAAVVLAAILARTALASVLLDGVENPRDRAEAAALLGTLLVYFAPQILAYLLNAVAVAHLQARFRIAASVICPAVNNVVLVATYLLFRHLRGGRPPSLPLRGVEVLTLGLGTLAGVVAMCSVPVIDALAHGARPAKPLSVRSPEMRRIGRDGLWAAVFLGAGQATLALALPLTNAYNGHGLVWMLSWQLFLVPYALLAVPVLTARFPSMAAAHDEGSVERLREVTDGGVRSIVTTGLLAGAVLWGTAPAVARVLSLGEAHDASGLMARALGALAPGIVAYGLVQFFARRSYAVGDTRAPAVVAVVVAAVVVGLMFGLVGSVSVAQRLTVLGASFTFGQLVGAVLMWWRLGVGVGPLPTMLRRGGAAAVAAAAARSVVALGDAASRPRGVTVVMLLGAALAGVAAFAGVDRLAGGPPLRVTLATLGAAERVS
ncbi:MAG: lipid II flippase MurJ [Microthrixaceae bacterium]